MAEYYPIIYVRGYAGVQSDVEETVDDPMYGFNAGSTHIRLVEDGSADFFMFTSPFARLVKDHGYWDVIDGALQEVPVGADRKGDPKKTIWIYRYYDPTSKTFDRPGGRRLTIEEAAKGLYDFIQTVKGQTGAEKVLLVAHSMGGLVCRCLIQKLYRENFPGMDKPASADVDKFFTYGTPHRGILFSLGGGAIEWLRDALGVNNSDDFGPARMSEYLKPNVPGAGPVDVSVIPAEAFDTDRVFCVIGTNAGDYAVAKGLSKTAVGPQSDGLVQVDSASVRGAHRAYVHRSHSGRYGMVNSEEGYQNLQRFFFGGIKVRTVMCNLALDYADADPKVKRTYQIEIQVAIRGLPALMHDRSLAHYSAESMDEGQFKEQMGRGGLPLYTGFLLTEKARTVTSHDGGTTKTMRYMFHLSVFRQRFKEGFLLFADHVERLPLWSDHLIVELRAPETADGELAFAPYYSWASDSTEPSTKMDGDTYPGSDDKVSSVSVPLPDRARAVLGPKAKVRFDTWYW